MKALISLTDPKMIADTKHQLSRTLYLHGRLKPNFPVPATIEVSDTAIIWSHLSDCMCCCCVEAYHDSLVALMEG
jgi:hypothetical protein